MRCNDCDDFLVTMIVHKTTGSSQCTGTRLVKDRCCHCRGEIVFVGDEWVHHNGRIHCGTRELSSAIAEPFPLTMDQVESVRSQLEREFG